MSMPGFEAEASLFSKSSSINRSQRQRYYFAGSSVQPQLLSNCLLYCEEICEGDIIGACMPSCVCRCRGGKHCGPLS
jgi:hypothetical protein